MVAASSGLTAVDVGAGTVGAGGGATGGDVVGVGPAVVGGVLLHCPNHMMQAA